MLKISIIVPVYNAEKYLQRCLDSLTKQSLKEIEIILVNDGSTDKSGLICEEYALADQRIKLVHQSNKGQAAARNAGIDIASGEYLGFVDSDDWVDLAMFEKLYNKAKNSCSDIVACNFYRIDKTGKSRTNNSIAKDQAYCNASALAELPLNNVLTFSSWNKIYKKDLFAKIRYKEGIIFEDIDIAYRLLDLASSVFYISEPLYYYKYNNTSTIRSGFSLRYLDEQRVLKEMYHFYRKNYPQYADVVYYKVFVSAIILYVQLGIFIPSEQKKHDYLLNFDRVLLWKIALTNKLPFRDSFRLMFLLSLSIYKAKILTFFYRIKVSR